MYTFKQYYLGCLAHASYLIGSNGEAAIVDPQRDVDQYIDDAKKLGLTIKYVLETHLHADFVSGHIELAKRTGAQIVFGAKADAEFEFLGLGDGEEVRVGDVALRIMETPGHTPESVTIGVIDTAKDPNAIEKILTGDTLFIGSVGRPDLVGAKGFTAQEMASDLYDSLWNKIMTLPDDVEVYPAHGAGSACGTRISDKNVSTIGEQRNENFALQLKDKNKFIEVITTDLPETPMYFPMNAAMNKQGAQPLEDVPMPDALSPQQVDDLRKDENVIVMDVREPKDFGTAHIPGSFNNPLGGRYANWAGSFLTGDKKVIIVAEGIDELQEAVIRLARVGLHNAIGYLAFGIQAWDKAGKSLSSLPMIDAMTLRDELHATPGKYQLLDVRRPGEYDGGHVEGAVNAALDDIYNTSQGVAFHKPTVVLCRSGQRSSTAASLLMQMGHTNLINLEGGYNAWSAIGGELVMPSAS